LGDELFGAGQLVAVCGQELARGEEAVAGQAGVGVRAGLLQRQAAVAGKTVVLQALRDGETRTRTGDTTIFSQMYADPEWARNPRSHAGFGGRGAQDRSPQIA
jgi:hypothetical protein